MAATNGITSKEALLSSWKQTVSFKSEIVVFKTLETRLFGTVVPENKETSNESLWLLQHIASKVSRMRFREGKWMQLFH